MPYSTESATRNYPPSFDPDARLVSPETRGILQDMESALPESMKEVTEEAREAFCNHWKELLPAGKFQELGYMVSIKQVETSDGSNPSYRDIPLGQRDHRQDLLLRLPFDESRPQEQWSGDYTFVPLDVALKLLWQLTNPKRYLTVYGDDESFVLDFDGAIDEEGRLAEPFKEWILRARGIGLRAFISASGKGCHVLIPSGDWPDHSGAGGKKSYKPLNGKFHGVENEKFGLDVQRGRYIHDENGERKLASGLTRLTGIPLYPPNDLDASPEALRELHQAYLNELYSWIAENFENAGGAASGSRKPSKGYAQKVASVMKNASDKDRLEAYLSHLDALPRCYQPGEDGAVHDAQKTTWLALRAATIGFGLEPSEELATGIVNSDWNREALNKESHPEPWSFEEILRKLHDTKDYPSTHPVGYLYAKTSPLSMHERMARAFLDKTAEDWRHLCYYHGKFYQYDPERRHYSGVDEETIYGQIANYIGKLEPNKVVNTTLVKLTLGEIKALTKAEMNTWLDDSSDHGEWLAFRNGLLDLRAFFEGKLVFASPSPLYFTNSCFPCDYDPKAECPLFDLTVKNICASEDGEARPERENLLLKASSGCLHPTIYPLVGRALFLFGKGARFKSSFFTALQSAKSPETYSSVQWEKLGVDESLAHMSDKDANFCEELPMGGAVDASNFKKLVLMAQINCRPLYGKSFDHVFRLMLLFATNHIPRFKEGGEPIYRRCLFFPCENLIPVGERDNKWLRVEWWREQGEQSGIVNRLLEAARRIVTEDGGTLKLPPDIEALGEDIVDDDDYVLQFLQERLTLDRGYAESKKDVEAAWESWYRENIDKNKNANMSINIRVFWKRLQARASGLRVPSSHENRHKKCGERGAVEAYVENYRLSPPSEGELRQSSVYSSRAEG